MLLMFERGIRGGITQAVHRYALANNKYMGDLYNPNKKNPATFNQDNYLYDPNKKNPATYNQDNYPPDNYPLDNYPLDNYPQTNTPQTITPLGQIPPRHLPPLRNFSSTYLGILCTYILHILCKSRPDHNIPHGRGSKSH